VTLTVPPWAASVVASLPYPVVFATVSGAHLYGFASVDSDLDLRASHLLPLPELIGLRHGPETVQVGGDRDGVELDVVSHDLLKFARLMLKPNGYVLEQLLSPLVVATSPLHRELIELAPACLTANHVQHYLGFAAGQWGLFQRSGELKPALYTLRVLLTGLHLMRTGEIEADLRNLWPDAGLPYVGALIEAKVSGEHRTLTGDLVDPARLAADVGRLEEALKSARETTHLPAHPTAADAMHALLIRARLP
jgi:predicted nucleotidyltransferase